MKFICTQENLRNALAKVSRLVVSSSSLPILSGILFKSESGVVKVLATNLETMVETILRGKLEEDGAFVVPAKTLLEVVSSFPSDNISMSQESGVLVLESGGFKVEIKTLSAEEFPLPFGKDEDPEFYLGSKEIKKLFESTVFAVSQNQIQMEISGVLFSTSGLLVKTAATDRYRLVESKCVPPGEVPEKTVIVPAKAAAELCRLIGEDSGQVGVSFHENTVVFHLPGAVLVSRILEGQYPPYEQILPKTAQINIRIPAEKMKNAVRAAGVFSQVTSAVVLSALREEGVVAISSANDKLGESKVVIEVGGITTDFSVVLNYRYILDFLNICSSPNVVVSMEDESSAVVFKEEGNENYLYLVMPIKN